MCGDTSRSANACDTRFEITEERARVLKQNGFEVVGRYLTGGDYKELRPNELTTIFNAGLKAFIIYQENNRLISDFSYIAGKKAGMLALSAAIEKKIPNNTVIYFAVDLDVYEEQIESYIIPYFQGINDYIGNRYKVGIYGPRLVCTKVSEHRLSTSSFVANMSSGFSCNIGQTMPKDWCFNQFSEIHNYNNDFDLDKVTYNHRIEALSSLSPEVVNNNQQIITFLKKVYDLASEYYGNNSTVRKNNLLSIQYILNYTYKDKQWELLVGLDKTGIEYIEKNIGEEYRNLEIYIQEYNIKIDMQHLAGAICNVLNNRTGIGNIDAELADLTGWAGDLLTFAEAFQKAYDNNEYAFATEDAISQLIGGNNNLTFAQQDFIQDIDAWKLYKSLRENRIDIVFNSYYNTTNIIERCNGFIKNRINYGYLPSNVSESDSQYTKVYKLAKKYLEKDCSSNEIVTSVFKILALENPNLRTEIIENVAKGFAKKVTTML